MPALRPSLPLSGPNPSPTPQLINRDADFDSLGPREVEKPAVKKKVVDHRPAWDSSKKCYTE